MTKARDILNATHLASRGSQMLPHADSEQPGRSMLGSELLTRREAEVLLLLREALPNAQIARALQVEASVVSPRAASNDRPLSRHGARLPSHS